MVGVLDKHALFQSFQELTEQDRVKWKSVIEKIQALEKKEKWYGLDLSHYGRQYCIDRYFHDLQYTSIKWTTRRYPNWNSPKLYELLYRWAVGNRKLGKRREFEIQFSDGASIKRISSLILAKDEMA